MLTEIFVSLLFLFGIAHSERTIWYVHPDSSLNSIQAGLDSCANNDIVLVGPGTYVENIIWPNTQGIHLISELDPEVTIIDDDSTNYVIRITTGVDSTTLISGFTICNGHLSNTNDRGADIEGVGIKYVREGGVVVEGKYEFSPFAGWFLFDGTLVLNDGLVVGGKLGYRLINQLVLEVEAGVTFTDNVAGASGKVIQAKGNLRYELPPLGLLTPYATVGAGYVFLRGFGIDDEAFAVHGGVGSTFKLIRSLGLRVEGRIFRVNDVWAAGTTTNTQVTCGLVFWF